MAWVLLGLLSWVLWVGSYKISSKPQKAKSYDKAAEDDLKLAGIA